MNGTAGVLGVGARLGMDVRIGAVPPSPRADGTHCLDHGRLVGHRDSSLALLLPPARPSQG